MTGQPSTAADGALAEHARALVAGALVWDNHACLPLRPGDTSFLPQLDRLRDAGVDVVSLNIGFGPQDLDAHIRMLASFRRWIDRHAAHYRLATNVADLDRARAAGQLAIVFDVEGMGPLDGGDHGLVQLLHDLGVRWMLVAYNRANAAGAGVFDADDPGLSQHGRAILAEMRRVGMVACCSHTGPRTALDVMAAAGAPVIFSHSNAAAVHAHPRNISDDLIRGCAATGGVVGLTGVSLFLGPGAPTAERLVQHIDHVVQLVGPDHAGLSLDYTFDRQELADLLANMKDTFPNAPGPDQPIDFLPPEALPEVVAGLLARGYADADISKVLGGNWRRIAEAVWPGAAPAATQP
ncbi:MAG TPA: membrane dipeptidase [Phenylobacterium sp.]|nr:membrane dipeptidase [Phenylobacterium sp.]